MKTNKLDKLFRNRLEGREMIPSAEALESFHRQLDRKHRMLRRKRWYRVAGLILLGSGIWWTASTLNRRAEPTGTGSGIGSLEESLARGTNMEETLSTDESISGARVSWQVSRGKAAVVEMKENKNATVAIEGRKQHDPVNVHGKSGALKSKTENEFAGHGKSVDFKGAGDTGLSGPDHPGNTEMVTGASLKNVIPKAVKDKSAGHRETVPIRIVYKKTGRREKTGTVEEDRDKIGLLRKGYKKVVAVWDRMDIKEVAKERLEKTREGLVAMNPVKKLRKEGDK